MPIPESDLTSISYDRSTRIANNLSEQAQTLELARDACFALGLPDIPGTRVWMADENFNWDGKWRKESTREIKIRQRGKELKNSLLMKEMRGTEAAARERMERDEEVRRRVRAGMVGGTAEAGEADGVDEGGEQRPGLFAVGHAATSSSNVQTLGAVGTATANETSGPDESKKRKRSSRGVSNTGGVTTRPDWASSKKQEQEQLQRAMAESLKPQTQQAPAVEEEADQDVT